MPVGTVGSVKAVHQRELRDDIKARIILGNTYHLYLRPGTEILRKAGGLHRFIGWERPILTDSGGFQVFSLSGQRKLREEGALFRSHIDGSKHLFTPENVVDIQRMAETQAALEAGRLYGAGIDAFAQEPPEDKRWFALENVVLGSHCAASTEGAARKMGRMATENIIRDLGL